jgi:cytidine deaminase
VSLVDRADEVARQAYAPYSNYAVGAVVHTNDGTEFVGTNVENAAYPLTQCAEKNAIAAAAAAGYRPGDIAAVGITASPCGGCRQWLSEWRVPRVEYRRGDGTIGKASAAELLPDTWELPE